MKAWKSNENNLGKVQGLIVLIQFKNQLQLEQVSKKFIRSNQVWSEIFKGSNFTSESQVMNGVERDAEVEHE